MTPLFMSFDITKSLEVYIGLKSNANLLSKRFKLGLFVSSLYDKKYSTQIMLLDEKWIFTISNPWFYPSSLIYYV